MKVDAQVLPGRPALIPAQTAPTSPAKGDALVPGALRLELLEAFLALAEELHFTRAAERLFLSQSGLSRRIGNLECLLGCSLLNRSTRSVELTDAGRELLPHARATLAAATAAVTALRAAAARTSRPDRRTFDPVGR